MDFYLVKIIITNNFYLHNELVLASDKQNVIDIERLGDNSAHQLHQQRDYLHYLPSMLAVLSTWH